MPNIKENIMFDSLFQVKTVKRTVKRGRKTMSKRQKVLNLLSKGNSVSWKTLRNRFDLKSPAAMVGKLRNEGLMIYENRSSNGVSYRVGTPSKAILIAGMNKVFGKQVAYSA